LSSSSSRASEGVAFLYLLFIPMLVILLKQRIRRSAFFIFFYSQCLSSS
jgi:hypothetical protein